jgi:myo-inositol-1(or 4)-monophosphatase
VSIGTAPIAASESDHADDLAHLIKAARAGGALALARFGKPQKIWKKTEFHPVCEADIEVNEALQEILCDAQPDYAWLSEESADDGSRLKVSRAWVVDPIDGTNAYLKHVPEFAVATALVEDGKPVAAAVYNPATDEMFDAVQGGGARLNGKPMHVTDADDDHVISMLASRSEYKEAGWPERFEGGSVRPMSSIAYKLALVAAGRFDATASAWPKSDWDICAGDLLVSEAGGCMSSMAGEPLVYNQAKPKHRTCLACNRPLHDALVARLTDLAAA